MSGIRVVGFVAVALLWSIGSAIAQEKAEPTTDPRVEYLVGRLKAFTIALQGPDEGKAQLQTKPLFRWQNPVSGANGGVFVWAHRGRPVLLSKTHVNDTKQHYVESMVPLTPQPFEMHRGERLVWSPASNEVQRQPITDVDPPAGTSGLRLTQMRQIARRLRMTSQWGEENRSEWQLRLLTTPLHRYSAESFGVMDGAIFGFVQGTNPEAVLTIEAVMTDAGLVWEATPTRLTGYAVKAWLDEKLVLDVEHLNHTPIDAPYYHHYELPSPYPFTEEGPVRP